MNFKILKSELLPEYLNLIPKDLERNFFLLKDAEISTDTFSFYISVASVFSSKIEGEEIELDSYIKYKKFGIPFLPDYTKKIDDLYQANTFAQFNVMNKATIGQAHRLLSKHILAKNLQGKLRMNNMYISTPDGKIEYVAALPHEVKLEMVKFYADIELLLKQELSVPEVFFYASMLHLVFVKIHPWDDGNGRSARLIEKWFLGQKLGDKAWFVPSERNYYQQHQIYYKNLRALGIEYAQLDFNKALPFLLMLPNCLIQDMV